MVNTTLRYAKDGKAQLRSNEGTESGKYLPARNRKRRNNLCRGVEIAARSSARAVAKDSQCRRDFLFGGENFALLSQCQRGPAPGPPIGPGGFRHQRRRLGLVPGPPIGPGGFSQFVPRPPTGPGGLLSRSLHHHRSGLEPGPPIGPGGFSQFVPRPPTGPGGLLSQSRAKTGASSMRPNTPTATIRPKIRRLLRRMTLPLS